MNFSKAITHESRPSAHRLAIAIASFTFALMAALSTRPAVSADVTSTWDGTSNNWTSNHWDSALFPNDGNGGSTYNAVINSGVVTLDQNITIQGLSGSGGTILLSGSNLLTVGDNSSTAFAGLIGGSGNLTKVGAGTLTLSGANSYSGLTTISGGVLSGSTIANAGTNSGFGKGSSISISNGAALQLTGVGGFTTNRTFALGSGGAVIDLTANGGTVLAVTGMISGAGSLTKTGNAQLHLYAANTYSGGTFINQGTLAALNNTGSATGSGDVTIGAAGQFNVGIGGTEGSVSGNIVNNGVLQFARSDDITFAGQISGTGPFVFKGGTGTLTLTGDNSYTGFNWITNGTLRGNTLTNNGSNSSFGRGNFVIQGGNLQYTGSSTSTNRAFQINAPGGAIEVTNSAATLTLSGSLSNNGSLTKQGAGTLAFSGANTYSGGTTVSAGTLLVNNISGSGTGTAAVNVTAGTLGGTGKIGGAITIGSGGHLAPGVGTGTLFANGGATLSSGTVLDYDLANATTVGGGVNDLLSITGDLTLGSSLALNVNAFQGDLTNGVYRLITYTGGLTGDASGLTIGSNNALGMHTYNFSSATPGEIDLIVGFAGAVWTGAASTSWDDGSNWTTSGKPTSTTDVEFPTPAPTTGATLTLTTGESAKSLNFDDNYTLSGGDLTVSDGTVNVAAGKTAAFGTVLTGNAGLTKTGTGTLQLNAANSYSGDTKITGGTLALANAGALQNSTLDYNNYGGALSLGTLTSATFGGLKGNQNLALTNSSSASVALTVGNNNADTTYAGQLSGGGSLTKVGTGTLTLSGSNSYTGTTTVSGGTLSGDTMPFNGNNSAFGQGSFVISNGSTLQYTGISRLTNSAISLGTGGGRVAVIDSTAELIVSGVISGSGALTKTGSGTLELFSAANTYSGGTTISSGTLRFDKLISMPSSGGVVVNSSATLAVSVGGTGQWANGTSGSGTIGGLIAGTGGQGVADQITWDSGSLLGIDAGSAPGNVLTYAGNIGDFRSGAGTTRNDVGLANIGGTLILSGSNLYTGGTAIRSGMLQFAKTTAMPSSGGITVNSATLAVNSGGTGEWTNGSTGGGTIGGLIAGIGGQGTANQITWNSGSRLAIDTTNAAGGSVTYSGVIGNFRSGTGTTRDNVGLDKVGSGTLTLAGSNTYSGSTSIRGGTLQFAKTGAMPSFGSVSAGNRTTLAVNAGGTGEWTNGTSGSGTIGGLIAGTGGQGGANQVPWADGSALGIDTTNAAGGALTYSGTIGNFYSFGNTIINNVGLTKLGSGKLSLTVTNTYFGRTIVNGGELSVTGGGSVATNEFVFIGNDSGSNGTLGVGGGTGTSSWTTLGYAFSVGYHGTGTMNVTGGGASSTVDTFIGDNSDGNGTVNVGGGTGSSTWTTNGFDINVGYRGTGTMNVTGGGAVSSSRGLLAQTPGSSGTVNVGGGTGSSNWTTTGPIYVGSVGTGAMTVTGGGTVSSNAGYIGSSIDSIGTVNVGGGTGTSSWSTNGGDFYVGDNGTGTLNISGGGTVSSGNSWLGRGATSTGNGVVSGTGTVNVGGGTGNATWAISGSLTVSNSYSTSTLNIKSNGIVSATGPVTFGGLGTLRGTGTLVGDVSMGGRLAPGNSPGIITIDGNYTQTNSGVLEIEVGGLVPGTDHDQVIVTGAATLGGTFEFPLVNNFHPQLDDEITFLTADSITGAPKSVFAPNLASVDPNLGFVVIKNNQDLRLRFVAPTDVHFVDNSNQTTQDWNQATKWDANRVPTTADKVDLTRSQAAAVQRIEVTSADASAYQVSVHDQSSPITIGIKNDKTLAAAVGDVTIGKNAAIELGTAGDPLDEGTLAASSSRSVTVLDGGLLAGNGTIKANSLVVSDGTLRPGFSVGHVDVEGNYQQGANGTLLIDVESASSFDTVDVTGSVQLGGTLEINASNLTTVAPGTLFPIVTASSITGDFDTVMSTGNDNVYFLAKATGTTAYAEYLDRGDMNGDAIIDNQDFDLFAYGLMTSGLENSKTNFFEKCECFIAPQTGGDFSGNGRLDFDDIAGFQGQLGRMGFSSAGLSAAIEHYLSPVPEPASALLLLVGSCFLAVVRSRRSWRTISRKTVPFFVPLG